MADEKKPKDAEPALSDKMREAFETRQREDAKHVAVAGLGIPAYMLRPATYLVEPPEPQPAAAQPEPAPPEPVTAQPEPQPEPTAAEPAPAVEPVQPPASEPEPPPPAQTADPAPLTLKQIVGLNIERLRQECGWSYDDLAGAVGIHKSGVIRHAHGKQGMRRKTLQDYVEAFKKKLDQPITADDLKRPPQ
jgi:ribosome-binding protein aMBF1 (putative translation factor)